MLSTLLQSHFLIKKLKFDYYSVKNIPVTTETSYLIKRMRWKVTYRHMKESSIKIEAHGLKSQKTPSLINEFAAFENDLTELVENIKFRTVHNQLQRTLKSDIKLIQQSSKTLTPADKTPGMHRLTKEEYIKIR